MVNLNEVLAVAPQFQLLPKHDLLQVLSINGISSNSCRFSEYLPENDQILAQNVVADIEENPQNYENCLSDLRNRLSDYEIPHAAELQFRKPVICVDNDTCPLPQSTLLRSIVPEKPAEINLVESSTVNVPGVLVLVPELPTYNVETNKKDLETHKMKYCGEFRRLVDSENAFYLPSRALKRPKLPDLVPSRKRRAHIDYNHIANSTVAAIYESVDGVDDGITEKFPAHSILGNLTRLITTNSLDDVHEDYLFRIQQLCSGLLNDDNTSLHDGITASRIMMLIINGSLHKRLMIDSFLHSTVHFVSRSLRKKLNSDISGFPRILASLSEFISANSVDELVLSVLEYMCFDAFVGAASATENALLHELNGPFLHLLAQIFRHHPNQRNFIIHELLLRLSELPHQRSGIFHVHVTSGCHVASFSLAFVILAQTVQLPSLLGKNAVEEFLAMAKNTQNPLASVNIRRTALLDSLLAEYETAAVTGDTILTFLLRKVDANPHQDTKALISVLVEDWLSMVGESAFPGAETLVRSLWTCLLKLLASSELQPAVEPFLLDICGKIGVLILAKRKRLECHHVMSPTEANDVLELNKELEAVFQSKLSVPSRVKIGAFISHINNTVRSNSSQNGFFWSDTSAKNVLLAAQRAVNDVADEFFRWWISGFSDCLTKPQYERLILLVGLNSVYDRFQTVLTDSLLSNKVKLVTRAVRTLSTLTDLDHTVLLTPRVAQTISRLLTSHAALSRDAVLELLSKFALANHELLAKYYRLICDRIGDASVSVRRKAVKVMEQILNHSDITELTEIRAYACLQLLRGQRDPESYVRDSSGRILTFVWLELLLPDRVAREMAFVMEKSGGELSEIRKFWSSTAGVAATAAAAGAVAQAAMELASASEGDKIACFLHVAYEIFRCTGQRPRQDDVVALQPNISDVIGGEKTGLCSLKIFRLCHGNFGTYRTGFLVAVQKTLLARLAKMDLDQMRQAVPILKDLSDSLGSGHENKLANVLVTSLKHLMSTNGNNDLRKVKLLQIVGCLGCTCRFEHNRHIVANARVGLHDNETVVSLILRILLFFAREKQPVEVQIAAVKGVFLVCESNPQFLLTLSVLTTVDEKVNPNSNRAVRAAVVASFNGFLLRQEEHASTIGTVLTQDHESRASSTQIDRDVFHGNATSLNLSDSVCTSVSQRMLPGVLTMCTEKADDISLAVVENLQLVVCQGYVNPKVCVATVLALMASPKFPIRKVAESIYRYIFDKHESLANRNFSEGVTLAVAYLKRSTLSFWLQPRLLPTVYSVVQNGYTSKKRMIMSICRILMETLNTKDKDLANLVDRRDVAVYLCVSVALMTLLSVEEVHLVLYHVDQALSRDGLDVSDSITKTVGSANGAEMKVEKLQRLFVQAQAAVALSLLRQTMMSQYSISGDAIDAFTPSRADIELRQAPKTVLSVAFPLLEVHLTADIKQPAQFGHVFMKLVSFMKEFASR